MACHPLGLQATRLRLEVSGAFLGHVSFAKWVFGCETPGA